MPKDGPFCNPGGGARLRFRKALRFNGFGRSTEVALHRGLFLLFQLLAEYVFVLRVGLGEVVKAEALADFHVSRTFTIFLHDQIDTPFDFAGWTFATPAKELIVFDLQLADVAFELAEFFVDGRHGVNLVFSNGRSHWRGRQPLPMVEDPKVNCTQPKAPVRKDRSCGAGRCGLRSGYAPIPKWISR